MVKKKNKSGKKPSKNHRHDSRDNRQREQPQQQQLQRHEEEQGQAHEQVEGEQLGDQDHQQNVPRSAKKWARRVQVAQERRQREQQQQQSAEDDAHAQGNGQLPQAVLHEPERAAVVAPAIVPGAIVGAADGVQRRRKKNKKNLVHDQEHGAIPVGAADTTAAVNRDTHLDQNLTTPGNAHHHLPNGNDGQTRIWQPDKKLLAALQSAQGRGRGADDLLSDFLKMTGQFAPIIQCRSLDNKQTPSSFYEMLLPLFDRTLTKCFANRPAECFRLLKGFVGSATFSDGLCRPGTLRTLSSTALRHLVSILQLAVQELPGETAADDGGYFSFPEDVLEGIVHGTRTSDAILCSETERLVKQLRYEREFESERAETLRNMRANGSYDEAGQPSDYRQVSLLPTDEELKVGRQPDLSVNRLVGRYADEGEYIETHFRLLREDFVGPLRNAVQEYVCRSAKGEQFRRLDAGGRLYRDVELLPEFKKNTIRFDMNIHGRALDNWESSKALTNGSLLVISRDDFWTMTYATVEEKSRGRDSSALLVARVISGHNHVLQTCCSSAGDRFTIIESESYYEAYRHNAAILQCMIPKNLPFKRYLIEQPTTINAPMYLCSTNKASGPANLAGQGRRYDLSAVVGSLERGAAVIDILDDTQWPKAAVMKLDESQAQALKFALTKEFAIIQGPPGTGKTYIGTKIVDVLLANEKAWTYSRARTTVSITTTRRQNTDTNIALLEGQSIVIICYTNHALDQFLEHLLKRYPAKIVRVGGNSGNAVLDQFNIKELMKSQKIARLPQYFNVRGKIENLEREIEIASKKIGDNLTWPEAADMLKQKLAKQIGSDERWKRWLACTDLADAAATKHLAMRLAHSSNSDTANGGASLLHCTEAPDHSMQAMARDLLADTIDPADLKVPPFNEDGSQDSSVVNDSSRQGSSHIKYQSMQVNGSENTEWQSSATPNGSYTNDNNDAKSSPLRMTYDEMEAVSDMWQLSNVERRRMLNNLTYTSRRDKESKISEHIRTLSKLKDSLHDLRMREMLPVFKDRPIVGMTVTGAAKYSTLMSLLKPRIVIIEEAAEVLEAHILTSLSESCQHLILIGDHQQLRPNPCMYELVRKYNLDVSLFERMVKYNGLPFIRLKVQHRMRPEISKVMSVTFYDDLLDHPCVEGRENVKGILKNIFFVNHRELEGGDDLDMRSHVNFHEAGMVVGLCGHLLRQAYQPAQITVLVAYLGQLFQCKRMLQQYQQSQPESERIRVTTVDNYQGEENDIIILSLVRSNDRGSVGFLSTDNRICVALSRARLGFYCFGNFELLSRRSDTWRSIKTLLSLTEEIGDELPLACHRHPDKQFCVSKPEDFFSYTEGHGCTSPCDQRLPCGHSCSDLCHFDDLSHTSKHKCRKQCMKLCTAGRHKGSCKRLCCQPCEPCREGVPRTFEDCGHTCNVECSITESDAICMHPVPTMLLCKHEAQTTCHQYTCTMIGCRQAGWVVSNGKKMQGLCGQLRDAITCFALVTKTYQPCGHRIQVSCHSLHCSRTVWDACTVPISVYDKEEVTMPCKDFVRRLCQAQIERTLLCGHSLTRICSDATEVLCAVKVDLSLPRCGHQVTARCSDDPNAIICSQIVAKPLSCGHSVTDYCCRDVTNASCTAVVEKPLPCGHKSLAPCSVDPGGIPCSAVTSERLPCGHELTYFCRMRSQIVKTCRAMVNKDLPCGHTQLMLCSQDERRQKCSVNVMKQLPCGHQVPAQCDQDISKHRCREQTSKKLPCEHQAAMPCFEGVVNWKCKHTVTKELPCGHCAPMLCHQEIDKQYPCKEQVDVSLPCSHVVKVSCSARSKNYPACSKVISKKLPCGHEKMLPCVNSSSTCTCEETVVSQLACGHCLSVRCFENDGKRRCTETVKKELPCGHTASLFCSEDPEKHTCVETVERTLPCNHVVQATCNSKSEKDSDCERPVSRQLPCGHRTVMPCFVDPSIHRCEQTITIHLPCGHDVSMKCHMAVEQHQCQMTVTKQLPCGHRASMQCFEDVSNHRCHEKVTKMLPCDHEASMLCFEDARYQQCDKVITKVLPCCHRASMLCSEDPERFLCQEVVDRTLSCGHIVQAVCSSNLAEDISCEQPVERKLTCGHQTMLACQIDVTAFKCEHKIKRSLACGHKKTLKCHMAVDQYQCLKTITKRLQCGHHAELQCFEDVGNHKCQEKVSKMLPCGHEASITCSVDARNVQCKTAVEKELPCGHYALMPCSQDVSRHQCETLVDKQLPCLHSVNLRCGSAISQDIQCQHISDKPLPCGHIMKMPCWMDVRDQRCLQLVKGTLPCGHSRLASCHLTRCAADGCQVNVLIQSYGNTGKVIKTTAGSCQSLRTVKCSAPVDTTKLPCGHVAPIHACGEETKAIQCLCTEAVSVKYNCGHEAIVSCHVTICRTPWCPAPATLNGSTMPCGQVQKQLEACRQLTSYTLPCGHAASGDMPCHATRCNDHACPIQLEYGKKQIECRALRHLLADCQAPIIKWLDCGHQRTALCQQSRLCTCRESSAAARGLRSHIAGGLGPQQQPQPKRHPTVSAQQHESQDKATVECFLHAPCNLPFEKLLECGHRRTVACQNRDGPVACAEQATLVVPTCGHHMQLACSSQPTSLGIRCTEEHCALICSHGGCTGLCSEPCQPCTRPCANGCPHSQPCRRPCFRECSFRPCDRPCGRLLSCGHPCLGLCGESCPDACLACPKGSHRQELLRRLCAAFGVRPSSKFIYLQPCGHVVPLEKMDEAVKRYEDSITIRSSLSGKAIASYRVQPLPCPSCQKPVGGCRRYDVVLKRYFNMKRKLPADVVGDWLGCVNGHVRPAAESSCSECYGSDRRQLMLLVGQEVAVTRGKDRGLVGTVTDVGDGDAVVAIDSRVIVFAIEHLKVIGGASLFADAPFSSAAAAAASGSNSGWQTVERRHTAAQQSPAYSSGVATMTFSRTESKGRASKD